MSFYSRVLTSAAALTVCVPPLFAQSISPQEAWDSLVAEAADRGVQVISSEQVSQGGALLVQNLRIMPSARSKDLVVTIPELRVSSQDEGVVLTPLSAISAMARFGGGVTRTFSVLYEGDIVYDVDQDTASLAMNGESFEVDMIRSIRRGRALPEEAALSVSEPEISLDMTRAGDLEFSLDAASIDYNVISIDDEIGEMSGSMQNPRIEFGGQEFDMISEEPGAFERAVDAGFNAHLRFFVEQSQGHSRSRADGVTVEATSEADASSLTLSLEDGRLEMEAAASTGSFAGQFETIPFAGDVANMSVGLELPMVQTPDMQTASYSVVIGDLNVSEQVLGMFNAQDFAGDSLSFTLRASADARVTQDLTTYEGDAPPFDVSELRLDELLLSVGDSRLTGAGAFAFIGGLLASVGDDVPNGTGDFTFDLVGGNDLLNRLVASGLVPRDQIFVVQMMMNGLGRAVGEDHLTSEVTIRPGGEVRVNGAPLPF